MSTRAANTGPFIVAGMERSALESMSKAVLAIATEREVEPVLRRLVAAARELAGARYAALGIPDGEGAFAQFITEGMSDELIAAMGPLPRTHGLLGAMLAAHAAVAIENARLLERSRELNIVEERNRLARELHDAVSQKLFGLVLNAEAASTLLARDPPGAADQVARLGEVAQEALAELRGLIFELRAGSA